MNATKLCAFDFADTLAELQPPRQNIVTHHIRQVRGIAISADHILRCYKLVDNMIRYSSVHTRTSKKRKEYYLEYNRCLLELLGVLHLVRPEGLFAAFGEHEKHWQLKKGVCETLVELRHRGYHIAILSNFDSCLEQIVRERLGLDKQIDYLHISQNLGIEKPDVQFYRLFFEKHNLAIKNTVYLGDNYSLDYQPAVEIGINTWLLDETGLYAHCPNTLRNVKELLNQIN